MSQLPKPVCPLVLDGFMDTSIVLSSLFTTLGTFLLTRKVAIGQFGLIDPLLQDKEIGE